MKRTAIVILIVLAMLVTAWLSLIRTRDTMDNAGEIKHFKQTPPLHDLRLSSGETLEEFYDKKIHLRMRPRPVPTEASMQIRVETPPTLPEGVKMGEPLRHTLQENETLADLAKRYHLSEYQIRKLNQLDEEAIPQPGSKLRIVPGLKPSYRVRPGDTLIAIGKRFGIDHREIIRLNDLEGKGIWAGQKLVMPIPQRTIDEVLARIEKKKREEARRKRRYERELIARLARQKMLRQQEEKRKAEEAERKRREAEKAKKAEAAKKAKAARAKQDRLSKARRAFKYTGSKKYKHKIHVVATAYTSHRSQTDNTPFLAAWNNRIRPGMKIIAVSPDLIRRYGLTNGVRVKIGGLPGTYVVRDKMNPRLRNHIDIYMGLNRRRALRWGRRRVVLYW